MGYLDTFAGEARQQVDEYRDAILWLYMFAFDERQPEMLRRSLLATAFVGAKVLPHRAIECIVFRKRNAWTSEFSKNVHEHIDINARPYEI